jgi:hypothetical protein
MLWRAVSEMTDWARNEITDSELVEGPHHSHWASALLILAAWLTAEGGPRIRAQAYRPDHVLGRVSDGGCGHGLPCGAQGNSSSTVVPAPGRLEIRASPPMWRMKP